MSKINKNQMQDGSVDSDIVEDESLTGADVLDGSLTDADLSATAGIQLSKLSATGAASGNGVVFNGTTWAPGTIAADAASVIAAGATLNTDTDVSGNSWVLDEDDMVSDSATKVPTQQSVKAYIDSSSSTPTVHATSHTDGTDDIQDATSSQKGLMTAAQATKLDGVEDNATSDQSAVEIKTAYESNANTNAFVDADKSKLDGIEALADVTDAANVDAAGATMNTDTDVSANAWVLDEDTLVTDSAIKVPTQQSVKAYVDNLAIGDMTDVDTTSTSPQINNILEWNGSLWVPTGPKPRIWQDTVTVLGSTGNTMTSPATYRSWTITNLPAGDYKFEWFYVWAHSSASNDFYASIDADGETMVEHRQEPKDPGTDQRNPECGFGYVSFATTANRTFTIYYGVEVSGQTASIHRSVMSLSPVTLV